MCYSKDTCAASTAGQTVVLHSLPQASASAAVVSSTCWLAAVKVWSSLLSDTCSSNLEAEGTAPETVDKDCSCCGMVVRGWNVTSGRG
jgi:hypothetical protein